MLDYVFFSVGIGILLLVIYSLKGWKIPLLGEAVLLFVQGQMLFGGFYFLMYAFLGSEFVMRILFLQESNFRYVIGVGGVALLWAGLESLKTLTIKKTPSTNQ